MIVCCIVGCPNNSASQRDKNITYHSFPSGPRDAGRRDQWIAAVNISRGKCKPFLRVCRRHFDVDCFNGICRRLVPMAVPTLHLTVVVGGDDRTKKKALRSYDGPRFLDRNKSDTKLEAKEHLLLNGGEGISKEDDEVESGGEILVYLDDNNDDEMEVVEVDEEHEHQESTQGEVVAVGECEEEEEDYFEVEMLEDDEAESIECVEELFEPITGGKCYLYFIFVFFFVSI